MVRRVLAVFAFAVIPLIVVPTALASGASVAQSGTVSLADLVTSSLGGTASFTSGANGCGVGSLEFDGSYPGSAAVGTVSLSIPGCLNYGSGTTLSFSGSFTMTTNVGMLSGSASGPVFPIGNPPNAIQPVLTLSVTAGTGSFAGTTGSLQAVLTSPNTTSFPTTFEGTITDFFTQVLVPSAGAGSLVGVTYFDADVYDAPGVSVTKVVFELNGQVIATGTPTIYGWLATWDSTSVANGGYNLVSVASDANGNTTTSLPVGIGVENPPPTTAVLIPSSGASVSGGSSLLDATASASDGIPIANVKFEITGGSYEQTVIGTATPTIYGYIFIWNTTGVPNGTYTLQSLVTDAVGNSDPSAGISVTVANPLPTTTVLIPSEGATLSGSTYIDASESNATSVEFLLFGGSYGYSAPVICTATPTLYGWLCAWNTTTVPNGSYDLVSEAFNTAGSTYSSGVGFTVNN